MYEVMQMKLKAIIKRMLAMCPEAWYIFIRAIQLCAALLLCAAALYKEYGGSLTDNYALYMSARALNETAQAVLLTGVLFSALIEDASTSQ